MNKFVESSLRERQLMTTLLESQGVSKFQFSDENSMDRWDGIYTTSKGGRIIFEVKCRNNHSNAYPDTIIEYSKYEALLELGVEHKATPYAFIFFTDGKCAMVNLKKGPFPTFERLAPMTTAGNNQKIIKTFVSLTKDKWKIIEIC